MKQKKENPLVWATKIGEKLNIDEMGITHMENCIKMLNRKYPSVDYPAISGSESDGAYWADQSIINQWMTYNRRRESALIYIKEFKRQINLKKSANNDKRKRGKV